MHVYKQFNLTVILDREVLPTDHGAVVHERATFKTQNINICELVSLISVNRDIQYIITALL